MRLLLDTHTLIWWMEQNPRLSQTALSALHDPSNELHLSSASIFELATKLAIKKLKLPATLDQMIEVTTRQGGVIPIPITFKHAARVADLPLIHRDPFDRLLIATAIESLTLLTDDSEVRSYPVSTHW